MSLRRDQPNAHFVYLFSGLAVGTAIGIYIGNKRRTGPPQRRDDNGDGDPPSPSTPKPLSAMMNDSLTQQRRPSRIELDSKMFQGATTNQYSNMSIPSTSPDAVMTRKQVPFPSLSSADAAATAAAAGGANASSSSSSSNAVVPKPLMRLKDTASWSQMAALVTPGKYKYVLAMVGLPARGKSYLVKMIMRYLRWTGISSEIFNVGNFRRKRGMGAVPSTFFDKNNADAQNKREQLAKAVQDDMYRWLQEQEVRVGGERERGGGGLGLVWGASIVDMFLDFFPVPLCVWALIISELALGLPACLPAPLSPRTWPWRFSMRRTRPRRGGRRSWTERGGSPTLTCSSWNRSATTPSSSSATTA